MSGTRVLVVDDEPQILRFLKPSLAAAGYEVISAATGKEALAAAATRSPDVILLDLGLPDGTGVECVRRLR
nr:response regulator [Hyphomicrobium sp.]